VAIEADPMRERSLHAAPRVARPTVISAGARRPLLDVAELWRFREVVFFLVWRDFKVKYRQTVLGVAWAVLQPLVAMGIFTLIFGKLVGVSSAGFPYPAFVVCGLVPWNFFARAVGAMTGCIVGNRDLVSRVYFPRIAIPAATLLSGVTELAIGLLLIAGTLVVLGLPPPPQALLAPLVLCALLAATFGIGLFLAALNVSFRDVGYIVPFALQILLFLTPVVYPAELIPEGWRVLYGLNPMAGVVEALRWCVLGTPADAAVVAVSAIVGAGLVLGGLAWFARSERSFPDVM
jgi:lipopolysaccharide transport system permease protein